MCTEFSFFGMNKWISARNLDWPSSKGSVMIFPEGTERKHPIVQPGLPEIGWTSKYSSISFVGWEYIGTVDGMNEHGLTASLLWLGESEYPEPGSRSILRDVLWAQYYLDNCKTVEEAVALAPAIRILPFIDKYKKKMQVHLRLSDPDGNAAVMEYLDYNLAIYHGKPLSVNVLANDPYLQSTICLKKYKGFEGKRRLPGGPVSMARFVRAAMFLNELKKAPPQSSEENIAYAFTGLQNVAELPGTDSPTQWSIVRDMENRRIYFRTLNHPNIRFVNLSDFSGATVIQELDINADLTGDVKKYFKPFQPTEATCL
ncbi:MAG: linear amide C-N hydrolase [Gammaproteobacteria bacterium]|nr:linear amide C-N hydrolase [Gammaproteobacteria bacterium]